MRPFFSPGIVEVLYTILSFCVHFKPSLSKPCKCHSESFSYTYIDDMMIRCNTDYICLFGVS